MNNDKGKLYYGLGLDNNQLRADAAESRNIIKGIGDTAVSEGNRIDSISHRIGAALAVAFSAPSFRCLACGSSGTPGSRGSASRRVCVPVWT